MKINIHEINALRITEVLSEELIITDGQSALDLFGELYFENTDRIIIHEKNISPLFFDLKTGVAGDVLQKFSNYNVRLAIVGEFSNYPGKSIRDFIFESNKTGRINFVNSLQEAIMKLS